jgi:hypothetical protein
MMISPHCFDFVITLMIFSLPDMAFRFYIHDIASFITLPADATPPLDAYYFRRLRHAMMPLYWFRHYF